MNILANTMLKTTALKAQDVLLMCKLFLVESRDFTFASLASDTGLSVGEVHNAVQRCKGAQLLIQVRAKETVSKKHLYDLLVFATPRIFIASRGGLEMGMPTGIHAQPLQGQFEPAPSSLPTVWPLPNGTVKGEGVSPLYPSIPEAASKDPSLYEILSLVDIVRIGDTRSRNTAVNLLKKKILGRVPE